jgi:hypothetical protein
VLHIRATHLLTLFTIQCKSLKYNFLDNEELLAILTLKGVIAHMFPLTTANLLYLATNLFPLF